MTCRLEPTKTVRSTIPGRQFSGRSRCGPTSSRSGRITTWPRRAPRSPQPARGRTRRPAPAAALRRRAPRPHHVGHAEEVGDEQGRRALVDLARRADLVDPALVHDGDPVAHAERLFLVVGDEDEGRPHLLLQRLQLDPQLAADFRVERAERLVEKQHGGRRTSARASATRCCWPPESWCGRRLARSPSSTSSSASSRPPLALGLARPSGSASRRRRCRAR